MQVSIALLKVRIHLGQAYALLFDNVITSMLIMPWFNNFVNKWRVIQMGKCDIVK